METRPEIIFTEDGFIPDPVTIPKEKPAWLAAIEENADKGVYELAFIQADLPASFRFLQYIAESFVKKLLQNPDLEVAREETTAEFDPEEKQDLIDARPYAIGSELINLHWLDVLLERLQHQFALQSAGYDGSMGKYFTDKNAGSTPVHRIYFHLVENKDDDVYPFAFMATYALKENGKIRHRPLSHALSEYDKTDPKLLELLSCLSKACEASVFVDQLVVSGEMFHPLRLSSEDAYSFLRSVEDIEAVGIFCRIPNWWKKKNASPMVQVKMANAKESLLGLSSLIKLQPSLVVNGEKISAAELRELMEASEGLHLFKGGWIEVNHKKLQELKDLMNQYKDPITLREALQMQHGFLQMDDGTQVSLTNGKWLQSVMGRLKNPETLRGKNPPKSLQATLRPYQKDGFAWLKLMETIGFGACLADDMGLGKTIQVLAYLENLRKEKPESKNLLVVPASLIGNWQKEAEKFAPQLPVKVLHSASSARLNVQIPESLEFLNVTTYQMATRLSALKDVSWQVLILDEAQAIKNPKAKQTKVLKEMKAQSRLALTGTPIENDLSNLWSLFDFLNTGLLGSQKEFASYVKQLNDTPQAYGRLKSLVSLFMLRRLKTDKNIISDLPDKIEETTYISLSKKQIALYLQLVENLEEKLMESDGMARRGLILASLTRLKQICNHPSQYLGDGDYDPKDSGKFEMLKEICSQIYERRERVLIFTQYREIIPELMLFLEDIFHAKGLSISGSDSIKARNEAVEAFNDKSQYVPFMVLSLKAAGTGLNLTSANHVIHFDRWWNPAVENQATDRAFRIGQEKNVIVHKFVCTGTIEEKIEELIESKKALAENVIGDSQNTWITEMSNEEVLEMLRLDL